MFLDWDNLEIPAKAFVRGMQQKRSIVIDEHTGEKYHAE